MLYAYQLLGFGDVMGQARTIYAKELKRLLDLIRACDRHAERNRTMLLFTQLCGMRIGEVCELIISDVLDEHHKVRSELRLASTQTKGSRGRTVFVPKKMLKEITAYIRQSILKTETRLCSGPRKVHHSRQTQQRSFFSDFMSGRD